MKQFRWQSIPCHATNYLTCLMLAAAKPKKGKKMDPMQSLVPNPKDIPSDEKADPDRRKELAQTIWRPDKLGELTYTQFWRLITERKIEKVRTALVRSSSASLLLSIVVAAYHKSAQDTLDTIRVSTKPGIICHPSPAPFRLKYTDWSVPHPSTQIRHLLPFLHGGDIMQR